MGRRGPLPKPTALQVLQGNPSHRPLPRNEPKPRPVAPACPEWLNKDARAEWRRVAPELERIGLLTAIDGTALAGYCSAYATMRQAQKVLDEEGLTTETGSGYIQQRPEVTIVMKSWQLVKAFAAEFGLTPSARARISVPQQEKDDSMGGLLD